MINFCFSGFVVDKFRKTTKNGSIDSFRQSLCPFPDRDGIPPSEPGLFMGSVWAQSDLHHLQEGLYDVGVVFLLVSSKHAVF